LVLILGALHLNPRKSRARNFYQAPVFGSNRHFIDVNRHAIAVYGIAVSGCDRELVAVGKSAYLVPLNLDLLGRVERESPSHHDRERQKTDACQSAKGAARSVLREFLRKVVCHSKTRVRLASP
jgi:hypothetical protein